MNPYNFLLYEELICLKNNSLNLKEISSNIHIRFHHYKISAMFFGAYAKQNFRIGVCYTLNCFNYSVRIDFESFQQLLRLTTNWDGLYIQFSEIE
ncbi:hypothetical protein BpHYR1_045427 [Brachionus plicatilis]|uniref:Uncharacterized protein n=1 Tax=Brachionus plicatilis TaxID=10195 RepID=A0A3M7PLH3_BRAPC|nr:hypothetical protein BpHYR1_045427 [Brachionus plicatilis]